VHGERTAAKSVFVLPVHDARAVGRGSFASHPLRRPRASSDTSMTATGLTVSLIVLPGRRRRRLKICRPGLKPICTNLPRGCREEESESTLVRTSAFGEKEVPGSKSSCAVECFQRERWLDSSDDHLKEEPRHAPVADRVRWDTPRGKKTRLHREVNRSEAQPRAWQKHRRAGFRRCAPARCRGAART